MENINIEDIMQQIRAEVKEKGYKESDLSFTDIKMGSASGEENLAFNEQEFKHQLHCLNSITRLDYYRPLSGGVKVFFKRVVRKLVKPIVLPLCQEQEQYNACNARVMNQLAAVIKEQEERIKVLEEIVAKEKENR